MLLNGTLYHQFGTPQKSRYDVLLLVAFVCFKEISQKTMTTRRVRWILQDIGDGWFHDSLLVGGLLALKTVTVLVMIRFPIIPIGNLLAAVIHDRRLGMYSATASAELGPKGVVL